MAAERNGIVRIERVTEAIDADVALVTLIHAQNEIGTIQPVAEIAHAARVRGAIVHTDAAQSVGKVPVNVSGGLLSKGHPLSATGIANVYEVALHLRGEAGKRQVPGARIGMTHVVGYAHAAGVHIPEKA